MTESKKRSKRKMKTQGQKRFVLLLVLVTLPILLIGGQTIALSVGEWKDGPYKSTETRGSSPQGSTGDVVPAIYTASFSLAQVYEQLNCVCGRCSKVLADCTCHTANVMRQEVVSAKGKNKAEGEILNLMLDRYGKRVLSSKAELVAKPPPGTSIPAIYVEPPSYDFGTIPQEVVSHSFTIQNRGNGELVIGKITTSCGCTTTKIDNKIIPPGEEVTLTVTFDPIVHDTKGKTKRTVYIPSNDPKYPVKEVKIKAFVKKEGQAAEKLPSFAYNSAQTLEGYRIATKIPHVLELIPCYCGCGIQSGHRHLKDCFIKAGGSFDEHGAGCDLCDKEAIDVKKWLDQNIPIKEIRARIDEKYKKYGPATKTPPI